MIDLPPDGVFSAASTLALICWIALALSLFVAAVRAWVWRVTGLMVPALLAVAYGLLIAGALTGNGGGEGGGNFNSIAGVRALFANDAALAAGWLHYLAFDLFVGTWIAKTGLAERIHPLLLLPALFLTLMFGPLGLLLFLILRLTLAKRDPAPA